MGPLVDWFDVAGMFWFAGAAALFVCLAMFWRRSTRRGPVTKEEYAPQLGTSVAAGEIAYGEEDAEHDGRAIAAPRNPR